MELLSPVCVNIIIKTNEMIQDLYTYVLLSCQTEVFLKLRTKINHTPFLGTL
jgi:hypothetical protein